VSLVVKTAIGDVPLTTTPPVRPVPLRVKPDGIPPELKAERRWVVWRYEWDTGRDK
jgi:hypothetical protein